MVLRKKNFYSVLQKNYLSSRLNNEHWIFSFLESIFPYEEEQLRKKNKNFTCTYIEM